VFAPWLAAAERYDVARAGVLCAVSENAADMARRTGADPARVIVVPNGVDFEAVDAARPAAPAEGPPRVGWVGSFGPWHGAEVLVRALQELPAVSAVMVGDGPEREDCERLARELGVAERVEFTGRLPHPEAIARLGACDVLASPHVPLPGQAFFGSPTKLFEYMAIGRPIVASALEQIGDVLQDGRTAILVEPGDPADLARGIRDALALPHRGRALGEAARADAQREHTWDRRARDILDRAAATEPTAAPGRLVAT
jgi:glycosyltransferase involved in cell wall biosynthesis